jgi:hypothetical protein
VGDELDRSVIDGWRSHFRFVQVCLVSSPVEELKSRRVEKVAPHYIPQIQPTEQGSGKCVIVGSGKHPSAKTDGRSLPSDFRSPAGGSSILGASGCSCVEPRRVWSQTRPSAGG